MELFNDIHKDSGGCLRQLVSTISLQRRLATVGITGSNSIQSQYPSNAQNNSKQAANDIMTYTIRLIMVFAGEVVRVRLDRGSELSSALACLSLNFCPTFRPCSSLLNSLGSSSRSFSPSSTLKHTLVSLLSSCWAQNCCQRQFLPSLTDTLLQPHPPINKSLREMPTCHS